MKRAIISVSLLCASLCSAQDFSVRLIDARNGHPLPNRTITISFTENQRSQKMFTVTTDAYGIASFQLPESLPPDVLLRNYDLYPCYQLTAANTQVLKQSGIVSRCSKEKQACRCNFGKEASEIKASPGQIILLARPETLWEEIQARLSE